MIRVSFTKFLDFVAQKGEPKATTALSAWRQHNTPYDPRYDYHKRVRDLLINYEKTQNEPDWDDFVSTQNAKKQSNYEDTIKCYRSWRKSYSDFTWFTPPKAKWSTSEFEVSVNPELGLILDGKRIAIKLFINRNKLSPLKANMAGLLMHQALFPTAPNINYGVLDVKQKKLHVFSSATEKLEFLLVGESAHLSAMLEAIRGTSE